MKMTPRHRLDTERSYDESYLRHHRRCVGSRCDYCGEVLPADTPTHAADALRGHLTSAHPNRDNEHGRRVEGWLLLERYE